MYKYDKFQFVFQLYENPDFLKLPAIIVFKILLSEKLNVSAEKTFKAVKLWVNYDEKKRTGHLESLLELVKLSCLSMKVIEAYI